MQSGQLPTDSTSMITSKPTYNVISKYLDKSNVLFKSRLDKSLPHALSSNPNFVANNDGVHRRERLHCILCCYKCMKGQDPRNHSRKGVQTTRWCVVCRAVLCSKCYDIFHKEERPALPQCAKIDLQRELRSQRVIQPRKSGVAIGCQRKKRNSQLMQSQDKISPNNLEVGIASQIRKRSAPETNRSTLLHTRIQRRHKRAAETQESETSDTEDILIWNLKLYFDKYM